jgi:hypothetical protein
MDAAQIADARKALANAERSSGQERKDVLNALATKLNGAGRGGEAPKVHLLAAAAAALANVKS